MGSRSSIEWTEATWNPVAGCTVLSPGCTNCYAMRMAARLALMGRKRYVGTTRKSGGRAKWNGTIVLDHASLETPQQWRTGRFIFVNSMSDLFHEKVPVKFIEKVFSVAASTPQHTFQVLTKRAERMMMLGSTLSWPENLWMGVSVENIDYTWRIECLQNTPAKIKFLSLEPLLSPLDSLDLRDIDWVIVGGESGPGARPMKEEWVRSIRDQCLRSQVAFHFKQWGGVNKKKAGRVIDGRTWDEIPPKRSALIAKQGPNA
jgi:protein gp37